MRADCFFERSHFLIILTSFLYYLFLQIPAEQQNCTPSTWDIFKSRLVNYFVSFNFCIFSLLIIKTMRESLSLASMYKKIQSLEQKQILKYELKLENNGERLLTLLLRSQERIVNGLKFQSFSLFKKDFLCSIEISSMMRCLML